MKRITSVSLPVAALVVARSAGLESSNDQSRRWSMPVTGGITVRF